jgi:hypothetical protein
MSQTFTQILYRLLANPEYLKPLRQEIEAAVAEEGWTKAGMDKMRKLDSIVRETQRIDTLSLGLSASLQNSHDPDACSSSVHESSRTTPIHIFQRRDHPSGHSSSRSVQCHPFG